MRPSASSRQGSIPLPQSSAWLRWLPFLVLLLAAVLVLLVWDLLPERWAVHWGRHGQPDRWARKASLAVFFPIGFDICMACSVKAQEYDLLLTSVTSQV